MIGLTLFATVIWRDARLPRWAGAAQVVGNALFITPFYPLELLAGALVCLGLLWMAASIWRSTQGRSTRTARAWAVEGIGC